MEIYKPSWSSYVYKEELIGTYDVRALGEFCPQQRAEIKSGVVMHSGSKSLVRVRFGPGSGRVRIIFFRFESGLGNICQVGVRFE